MRYLCVLVATLAGASAQTTAAAPAAPPDAVAAPKPTPVPTPVPTPEPTPEPTPAPIVPARGQCEALQTLFEKTRGASWHNNSGWMTTYVSCCKWHGITCDAEGFITKIELPFNKLAGAPLHPHPHPRPRPEPLRRALGRPHPPLRRLSAPLLRRASRRYW